MNLYRILRPSCLALALVWGILLGVYVTALNNVRPLRVSSGGRSLLHTGSSINEVATDGAMDQGKLDLPIGLYVHIPYCRRRCRYCDFAIVPIGTRADTESSNLTASQSGFRAMDQTYANAILKEMHLQTHSAQALLKGKTGKIPLRSIYFGGGTPSLAPVETLRKIISAILDDTAGPFIVDLETCEITIEADPGTFSLHKLRAFRDIGFNRISLGVQSFDDRILESIGRVHRYADIMESIKMIQAVYGNDVNYSIDLISGLPGLSLGTWAETLETALHLDPRPAHLSIYDLQVESVRSTNGRPWQSVRNHLMEFSCSGDCIWAVV
jgi:coproporphyrinogen III oxidase-like Fe-S oxidoreductase